jgi:hypothetical protein
LHVKTIRLAALHVSDDDGVSPTLRVQIQTNITDDDPVAVAITGGSISDMRTAVVSRAAFNAFAAAIQRSKGDPWPDGALAYPIGKAP